VKEWRGPTEYTPPLTSSLSCLEEASRGLQVTLKAQLSLSSARVMLLDQTTVLKQPLVFLCNRDNVSPFFLNFYITSKRFNGTNYPQITKIIVS